MTDAVFKQRDASRRKKVRELEHGPQLRRGMFRDPDRRTPAGDWQACKLMRMLALFSSHRSSFVGAVLLTLPGTHLSRTSPPRIQLVDPATQYKLNQAGSINAWWSGDPGSASGWRSPTATT
jgi:hypothetical protein